MNTIAYQIERPHVPIVTESIQPWLNAQRIGVTAYWTMAAQRSEQSPSIKRALFHSLREHLSEYVRDPPGRLLRLPPSVLYLLNALLTETPSKAPKYILNLHTLIKKTIASLNIASGNYPSHLHRARIVAFHIINSNCSARRLISLGASLFAKTSKTARQSWQILLENPESIHNINQLLKTIRDPNASTIAILLAIGRLGHIFKEISIWPQTENVLLTRTFCWPLLVSSIYKDNIGISLPVAIDVELDNKGRVPQIGNSGKRDGGGVETSDLLNHLSVSVTTARVLWLSTHGNHGLYRSWKNDQRDFRYLLNNASVLFNFYWANRILGDLHVSLGEGSANSYFAMAVLAKFLGRRSSLSSLVTGVIGEQCTLRNGQIKLPDYWVKAPGGVAAKLRYVFANRSFERVILPQSEETQRVVREFLARPRSVEIDAPSEEITINQTAEVVYATKLSDVANSVQTDGWRQYRYIRCPEIQWSLPGIDGVNRSGLMDIENPNVQSILNLLRRNTASILDLQDTPEATPRTVAFTLGHINRTLRNNIPLEQRPPMFSMLFFRVAPDQKDNSFWEVLWRAIGASQTGFEHLDCAPSPSAGADILAKALNRFQPSRLSFSHRAPDILVIIGLEHVSSDTKKLRNPLVQPLAITKVIDELGKEGLLRIAPNAKDLSDLLGQTRIILLRDHLDVNLDQPVVDIVLGRLTKREYAALSALSTFRWGFSHTMATLMLHNYSLQDYKDTWGITRNFLQELVTKGALRYSQGWYHLPFLMRDKLQRAITDEMESAGYHLSAGAALAPYTQHSTVPTLAFDEAYLPQHIHEALFHFDCAEQLATNKTGASNKLSNEAHDKKVRVLRFAAPRTRSTLMSLITSHRPEAYRDAYALGKELIAEYKKHNTQCLHPGDYINIIKGGLRWRNSGDLSSALDIRKALDEELAGPDGLFETALEACEDPYLARERNFNRLMVLCYYTDYLDQKYIEQKDQKYKDQRNMYDMEMLSLIDVNEEDALIVPGEWFERIGDELENDTDAVHLYIRGIRLTPKWHQLWIKAFWTGSLMSKNLDCVMTTLVDYVAQQAQNAQEPMTTEDVLICIICDAKMGWKSSARELWVKECWNTGVAIMENIWGRSPRVRHALQELKRY